MRRNIYIYIYVCMYVCINSQEESIMCAVLASLKLKN